MPSTLVHVALGALIASALLGRAFGPRPLLVVLGVVVLVDLDVFVGLVVTGAHRSAFHTLVWPALAGVALLYDTRVGDTSALRDRFGRSAPRVAWVSVAAVVLAAIGPDLVTNGVNLLYPVHDQFYALDGKLELSSEQGVVQTFFESASRGSTSETQYFTGVDPNPSSAGAESVGGRDAPERVFPVVGSGMQLLIVVTGAVTVAGRLFETRRADDRPATVESTDSQ